MLQVFLSIYENSFSNDTIQLFESVLVFVKRHIFHIFSCQQKNIAQQKNKNKKKIFQQI